MKKHLIAAAVATAVSVPALAQNATLYGTLDFGFQNYDNGATTFTRSVNGPLATSRIGVRGSEDLGGGLKANFQIQGTLQNATSTSLSSTGTGTTATDGQIANSSFSFNEEAWVGLSGAFGEIRVGRTDNTLAESIDTTVSQMGNLGNSASLGSTATIVNGELGGNAPSTVRYISPSMNGLQVQVGYTSKNDATATTETVTSITGFSVRYDVGSLSVMGGYTKEKAAATLSARDHTAIGAMYNFGVASVGVYHSRADQSTVANAEADTEQTNMTVKVPLSNGFALHGGFFKAKLEDSAVGGDGYTLAVSKALSKRTTVYAGYSSTQADAGSYFAIVGTNAAVAAGEKTRAVTAGIAHSF